MTAFFQHFEQFRANLTERLRTLEKALPEGLDWTSPGLRALAGKPGLPITIDGLPLMTVALYGPTGAGKSTIFRQLTGLEVPAGDVERPVTHATCIAVPRNLAHRIDWPAVFPEYTTFQPLRESACLRRQNAADILYYAPYDPPPEAKTLALIADCPDFNSIDRANWDKAARMISRADTVLFLSDRFAYADATTIEKLAQVCSAAGQLFFLLTRAERDEAEKVWRHLLLKTREMPLFGQTRADGTALHFFLGHATAFFSPYAPRHATPLIEALQHSGHLTLATAIHGENGRQAILAGLRETARTAARETRSLLHSLEHNTLETRNLLQRAQDILALELRLEAIHPFPLGALLAYIMRIARETRPGWLQWSLRPITWFMKPARRLIELAGQLQRTARRAASAHSPETIERASVDQIVRRVVDEWRTLLPGRLSAAACSAALDAYENTPFPETGSQWSDDVEADVRAWLKERTWMVYLGVLNDLLFVLGSAFVMVDVMSASISSLVVPGVIAQTSSIALKLFEEVSLGGVLRKAQREWRDRRSTQLRDLVWRTVARPLFAEALEQQLERIRPGDMQALQTLCDRIEEHLEEP